MEKKHKELLRDKFASLIDDKEIITLDIKDDYKYMDTELIETELITQLINSWL